MANISQIKDTAGNQYLIKDAQCRSDLSTLSSRYQGLATTVLDQGFRIDDIEVAIPSGTSTSNKLVNNNGLNTQLATKQDLLTAGANITISNGVISANVPGMSVEVVSVLPATGDTDKIYLVPKSTAQTSNIYDEYIYVNNNFELIGDTEIDLTNYYTKAETAAAINAGDAAVMSEVTRVENLVNINTSNITTNTNAISTLNTYVYNINDAVSDLSHDVQDNTSDIATNTNAISALNTTLVDDYATKNYVQACYQSLDGNIMTVNSRVTTNTSNITSLQTNKQDKLTAGTGISINNSNVISSLNPGYGYITVGSGTNVAPNSAIVTYNNPLFAYEYIIFGSVTAPTSTPFYAQLKLELTSTYGTYSQTFSPIIYVSGTPPTTINFYIKITTGYNPGIPLAFVEVYGVGGSRLYTLPTNMQQSGNLTKIVLGNDSSSTQTISSYNIQLYRRFW